MNGNEELLMPLNEYSNVKRVIGVVSGKGGVGKTTTSINLAASLGYYGKKVLLVDLDPQGNTTTGIGINKGKITYNLYDVLIGACNIKDSIIVTKFKNLSVLPASINLSSLEADLRDKSDIIGLRGEQLKHNLSEVKDDYDYIIVDCPPTLSILITNALTASDSVIIPVQCEFLALEGIVQLNIESAVLLNFDQVMRGFGNIQTILNILGYDNKK